jgi:hypothetical protein
MEISWPCRSILTNDDLTSPFAKRVICVDHDFTVEDQANGTLPRVPIYPHLAEVEIPEEFKVIYHYTSWSALQAIICTGIFPGEAPTTA